MAHNQIVSSTKRIRISNKSRPVPSAIIGLSASETMRNCDRNPPKQHADKRFFQYPLLLDIIFLRLKSGSGRVNHKGISLLLLFKKGKTG